MSQTLIVVDQLSDWSPYAQSEHIIDLQTFINRAFEGAKNTRVINLCRNYRYLSEGYYCSLVAESYGMRVSPSLRTLGMLNRPEGLRTLRHIAAPVSSEMEEKGVFIAFGQCREEHLQKLARQLFSDFNFPLMRVHFPHSMPSNSSLALARINAIVLNELSIEEEDFFAQQLERQAASIWKQEGARKGSRLNLAILIDSEEKLPPSDRKALKKMQQAASTIGMKSELIQESDFFRLGEFDALFIRTTTAVNHYTYTFAVEARRLGIPVLDDPESILKCTNKVFLTRLLQRHKISIPDTRIIARNELSDELLAQISYPTILKIPDGSFSIGVTKAENPEECKRKLQELFEGSYLILQQEYLYTDHDWRIGILNKNPLFACKYQMAKGHWQIYQHKESRSVAGSFETIPIRKVPSAVLKLAVKAASLIGDGLYGVDLKWKDGKAYIIEINDNPSLDYGVEDQYQGDELYRIIMLEFMRRIYQKQYEPTSP